MNNYELTSYEFQALVAKKDEIGLVYALCGAVREDRFNLKYEEFNSLVASVYSALKGTVEAAEERYDASQVSSEGSAFLTVSDIVALIKCAHEGGNSTYPIGGLLERLRKARELDPDMQRVRDAFDEAIQDRSKDVPQEARQRAAS